MLIKLTCVFVFCLSKPRETTVTSVSLFCLSQIIYTVSERLLELAKKGSSLQQQLEKNGKSHTDLQATFSTISQGSTKTVTSNHSPVTQSASKDSLIEKRRKKKSLLHVRTRMKSLSMEDLADDKFKSVLDDPESESQSLTSSNSGIVDEDDDDDDNNSIVFGNSVTDLKAMCETSGSSIRRENSASNVRDVGLNTNGRRHSPLSDRTSHTETSNWSIDQSVSTIEMSEECVQKVAYALSADRMEDYIKERANKYEVRVYRFIVRCYRKLFHNIKPVGYKL